MMKELKIAALFPFTRGQLLIAFLSFNILYCICYDFSGELIDDYTVVVRDILILLAMSIVASSPLLIIALLPKRMNSISITHEGLVKFLWHKNCIVELNISNENFDNLHISKHFITFLPDGKHGTRKIFINGNLKSLILNHIKCSSTPNKYSKISSKLAL